MRDLIAFQISARVDRSTLTPQRRVTNEDGRYAGWPLPISSLDRFGDRLSLKPKRTLRDFTPDKFVHLVRIAQRSKFTLEDGVSDCEGVPALNVYVFVLTMPWNPVNRSLVKL